MTLHRAGLAACLVLILAGCGKPAPRNEVVIYTSLDRPHSAPILERFEKETGIQVRAVYDTEASKTVGLVNRLMAEKKQPQADVFWNSEVLRTLVLKREGVLDPYTSPSASSIPQQFKDPEGYWTGFAARARVILVNTNLVSQDPSTQSDFLRPEWKDRFSIANPLFGTTGTEVAAWWVAWGPEATKTWLAGIKANGVKIASGNATARDMVSSGEIAACFTDTDDAFGAISNNRPVRMIIPGQGPGEQGTLLIPNTVALIKGGPNAENARKLIDFLLSEETERQLAFSSSGQIPVRAQVPRPPMLEPFASARFLAVQFEDALNALKPSGEFVKEHFVQ